MDAKEMKEFLKRCVEINRGDDLARAMHFFRGMSPEQMKEQHGQSGRSRNEVLATYINHGKKCDEAIAWIEANCR